MRLTSKAETTYTLTDTNGAETAIRIGREPVEVPDAEALRLLSLHSTINALDDREELKR